MTSQRFAPLTKRYPILADVRVVVTCCGRIVLGRDAQVREPTRGAFEYRCAHCPAPGAPLRGSIDSA